MVRVKHQHTEAWSCTKEPTQSLAASRTKADQTLAYVKGTTADTPNARECWCEVAITRCALYRTSRVICSVPACDQIA